MGLNIHISPSMEDAARFARLQEQEDRDWAEDQYIESQTRKAESAKAGTAEILRPGYDPFESMSWDTTKTRKERTSELREMRRKGEPLRPQARNIHGESCTCGEQCKQPGQIENIYVYDEDLEVFANGLACVNCTNWVPDNPERQKELHIRLAHVTGTPLPGEDFIESHCGYCGTTLTPRGNDILKITTKEVA